MHIGIFVEEQSAEAALSNLLPRLVPESVTWNVLVHQGKQDLLRRLPERLKAYRRFLPPEDKIVVLVDEDRENCVKLKSRLDKIALEAGLVPKSAAKAADYQVINRLAIEELEAWFLGDVEAIVTAFPRIPHSFASRRGLRDPDAIAGGTAEALERILKKNGYYRKGMPKIAVSRQISQHMDPLRNRSRSFQTFREAIDEIVDLPETRH